MTNFTNIQKALLSLSFLFSSFLLFSQGTKPAIGDGIISGRIIDAKSEVPMEYVAFKLYKASDSTLYSGIYTDAEGKFTFEQIPYGNYYGKIVFAEYNPELISDIKISTTVKVANLGTIRLRPVETKALGEVKVVGQLDVLKAGIDKKVYNVGEDLSVKGGTANDVLNNIPSVEVNQEGGVTLRGDGAVTVLIDGRPSSISGGNGKTLLDALPAGSIERIEVVTNPSAKYDPDGTFGIINIVLKKNKMRGFNGLITSTLGSGDLNGGNVAEGSISLSYRNSKLNTFGSYSGRYLDGYRNNFSTLDREITSDSIIKLKQDRFGTDQNFGHTFRAGADFYLKPRNVLGFSVTGSIGERNRTGDQWSKSSTGTDSLLRLWKRYSDDPSQQQNFDFNLNYKHDLKEDRGNWVVDLNQSLGSDNIQGFYFQQDYNADSTVKAQAALDQRLFNKEKNNITSGQFDFTYLMPKKNARLETGVKTIIRQQSVNTYSETLDTLTSNYLEDTLSNFDYAYNEQIYSAYGIFGQQLKKFKYQVGLRVEKAYQIPELLSDTIRIVNDYFNIFPSAHIRYAFTEKSEISLSYSRRINRAQSADLNPFTSYADPYNLRRGNPYLQPEFIDSYDLGYSNERKLMNFTTSVFYRHTTGVISRIKTFDANNVSTVSFANLDESHSVGAEAIFVIKPYKWWRNTLSANANYTQYVDDNTTANWNVGGFNWNMKYSGTVEFWKRTASIQVNATYNGPRVTVQGVVQRRGPVDISAEKTFKEGKISVGMRVSDVFNRQGFYMTLDQPGIDQSMEFKWLTRRLYLTFSYKFGKIEMSPKKSNGGGEGGGDF